MKHCINRSSKVFKFLITLITLGLLTGIIFYLNLSTDTKESITASLIQVNSSVTSSNQNNIIFHLFIVSVFVLASLTLLLYPLTFLYLFYELLSYGFILAYYFSNFGVGGLLYSLIYFILNKVFFLIILIYISIVSFQLIKKIINSLRKKDNIGVRELYQNYFLKIIISATFMLFLDIIIYFLGNKILSLFQFLL